MSALKKLFGSGQGGGGARRPASSTGAAPPAVDPAALEVRIAALEREAVAVRLDVDALAAAAHVADVEAPFGSLRAAGARGLDPRTLTPDLRRAVARLIRSGEADAVEDGRVRLTATKLDVLEREDRREAERTASQVHAIMRSRRDQALAEVVADPRRHPALARAAASLHTTFAEALVDWMTIASPTGEEMLRCRWCGVQGPLGDGKKFKVVHGPGCVARPAEAEAKPGRRIQA